MQRVVAIGLIATMCIAVGTTAVPAAVRVGDELPAVILADWQGGAVDLTNVRPRVMIVDFWASWCQPCRTALPVLNAMSRKYAADGLRVYAVNIDKTRAPADAFLTQHVPSPAMILLRDPGGAALARYGAAGMPALYVVDRRGVVRLVESGFSADKLRDVEALVTKLLAGGEHP
jgi:thiol-disulfide isomerase/thioredoxin